MELLCKQIAIDGVENVRDLGCYEMKNGKKFPEGIFYRSAGLQKITPKGKEQLQALGLEYVVDLRSSYETTNAPDNLEGIDGITSVHIPMLDNLNSSVAMKEIKFPESMQEMYRQVLAAHGEEFKKAFEVFAKAEGAVLFHCTAGKDRTGLTAMLLYGLTGVSPAIIADDYSYSEKLLTVLELPDGFPAFLVQTKAPDMQAIIEWINAEYGSIEGYLTKIGVSKKDQNRIKNKLGV